MANLNNTLVQGDLRVTGTIYGNVTDARVMATAVTTGGPYKLLATSSASPTSGVATTAVYDTGISVSPSTHTITAEIFNGNASSATKVSVANQDSSTSGNPHTSYILGWDTSSQPSSPIIPVKNSRIYSTLYDSKSTLTCDHIRALEDGAAGGKLEPYLTVHRGFAFSDDSPDNRKIESIGYYTSDTIDAKNTFTNFGLLFKYPYGILRYRSSYVISHQYTPDYSTQPNYPQPDYNISDMKFWGTAVESLHANSADTATTATNYTTGLTTLNINDEMMALNDVVNTKATVFQKTYTSATSGLSDSQYHDWNNLVDTGIYELQGDSDGNAPNNPESGAMTLIVIKVTEGNQTYIKQLALGTEMYVRTKKKTGSWTTGGWYQLVSSQQVHTLDCSGTVGTANGVLYFT